MAKPTVDREEIEAAIEARKELGAELEPAVIDSFVERIEKSIVKRDEQREKALKRQRDHQKEMVLGAMALSIPLMAIGDLHRPRRRDRRLRGDRGRRDRLRAAELARLGFRPHSRQPRRVSPCSDTDIQGRSGPRWRSPPCSQPPY